MRTGGNNPDELLLATTRRDMGMAHGFKDLKALTHRSNEFIGAVALDWQT